jgi:WD40 repeat protein
VDYLPENPVGLIPSLSEGKDKVNSSRQDWGNKPDIGFFVGREHEKSELTKFILEDNCRFVSIFGMGGMGKTALSLFFSWSEQENFEYIIWRDLVNIHSVHDFLQNTIIFLSGCKNHSSNSSLDEQISTLLSYMKKHRCLIILDNIESILQSGECSGQYQKEHEYYGILFEKICKVHHQSCLLTTTKEKPRNITNLAGKNKPARFLDLGGLDYSNGRKIFYECDDFKGSDNEWKKIIEFFDGNPFALELCAEYIKDVFCGSISEALKEERQLPHKLNGVLEWHFNRLSIQEKEIIFWLAINREPVSISDLKADILLSITEQQVGSVLQSLQWKLRLKQSSNGLSLQPSLLEYITDKIIEQVHDEIKTEQINLLNSHALMKAQSKDYIREMQIRLIVNPLKNRLIDTFKSIDLVNDQLIKLKTALQRRGYKESGYVGGNVLNLLCQFKSNLNGSDFSNLALWQVYLQNIILHNVNMKNTDLSGSVFMKVLGSVWAVACSSSGKFIVTGDMNGDVCLWQIENGQKVRTYSAHANYIRSVCFSLDEYFICSAGDESIRLWSRETGQCLQVLDGHMDRVNSITFSPDSKTILSGSDDKTIRTWDVKSGECLKIFPEQASSIWSVAFSTDGKTIVSGSDDHTIKTWDTKSGECLKIFLGHTGSVKSVAFSPDSKTIVSGGDDHTIRTWNTKSGKCLGIFLGHSDSVRALAFSPDSKTIVSGGDDNTIRIWEAKSRKCLNILTDHQNSVRAITFNPNGQNFISGGIDQTAKIWEVFNGKCVKTLKGYTNQINSVTFSPDGKMLASGSDDQMIRLWNCSTGEEDKLLSGHTGRVWAVAFSPDSKTIASGSNDKTIVIWDVSTGKSIQTLREHNNQVWSVTFSPDGTTLIGSGNDKSLRVWDVATGNLKKSIPHECKILRSAFSPDGLTIATGCEDYTVKLWDVETGNCLRVLKGHTNHVWSIDFSLDGRLLVSAGDDLKGIIWDIETGKNLNVLYGHNGFITSIAFSPDTKRIASGSIDNTIKIWDVITGRCLDTFIGHTSWVWSIAFHPDCAILATSSKDENLKLWDLNTGECMKTMKAKRPYEGMNITGSEGLSEAQKSMLKVLGVIC